MADGDLARCLLALRRARQGGEVEPEAAQLRLIALDVVQAQKFVLGEARGGGRGGGLALAHVGVASQASRERTLVHVCVFPQKLIFLSVSSPK